MLLPDAPTSRNSPSRMLCCHHGAAVSLPRGPPLTVQPGQPPATSRTPPPAWEQPTNQEWSPLLEEHFTLREQ